MQDDLNISYGQLLENKASADPERVFLLFGPERITLGELNSSVNRLAHALVERYGPGVHVSIMMPNSPRWLAVYFATQKIGACAVPINVALRGEGLSYVIAHSNSRVLFIDPAYAAPYMEIAGTLSETPDVVWDTTEAAAFAPPIGERWEEFSSERADNPVCAHDPEAISALLYTSGTTGLPKGVVMRYRAATPQTTAILAQLFYRSSDVLYTCLPLFHANALFLTTINALVADARMALGRRFSASRFWDEIRSFGATTFNALGAMIPILMKQPERADDADNPVQTVFSAACPASVWQAFEKRFGVRIIEGYGAVDGGGFMTLNLGDAPVGSIGKPPPGVVYKIVDAQGREVPKGEPGELLFRIDDPQARKVEYYRDPEASAKKVTDGWLRTGDMVWADEQGYLYFVDRLTDSMRRRGENVSSYEVEREVNKHPSVLECAAFGVPSELGEDDIMVAVVPKPGATVDPAELTRFLEGKLAAFMIPRYVDIRSELPKTETHRVQKGKLKKEGITATTWDRERQR